MRQKRNEALIESLILKGEGYGTEKSFKEGLKEGCKEGRCLSMQRLWSCCNGR